VDEEFARRYWPQGNAIGGRLFQGPNELSDEEAFVVVGIVGVVKQGELTDDSTQGAVYFPFAHQRNRSFHVVTRTQMTPQSFEPALQSLVRRIDPELPIADIQTMETRIADTLIVRRSASLLTGIFAGVALFLTAFGIYGAVSYAVGRRRREIGIRIALGALPSQIRRQFLMTATRLILAGSLLGLAGAVLVGRAIQSILFNVPAIHFTMLVITAAIVILVTLFACLVPSRRAARISPVEVLY
jgi:ABC-type antimicrobial peptide transport system permease subunit